MRLVWAARSPSEPACRSARCVPKGAARGSPPTRRENSQLQEGGDAPKRREPNSSRLDKGGHPHHEQARVPRNTPSRPRRRSTGFPAPRTSDHRDPQGQGRRGGQRSMDSRPHPLPHTKPTSRTHPTGGVRTTTRTASSAVIALRRIRARVMVRARCPRRPVSSGSIGCPHERGSPSTAMTGTSTRSLRAVAPRGDHIDADTAPRRGRPGMQAKRSPCARHAGRSDWKSA